MMNMFGITGTLAKIAGHMLATGFRGPSFMATLGVIGFLPTGTAAAAQLKGGGRQGRHHESGSRTGQRPVVCQSPRF